MTIDAIAPAPWTFAASESHKDKWIVRDAEGKYVATLEIRELAELIVLARNAEDIQMRRGWHAVRMEIYQGDDDFVEGRKKWFVAGLGLKPPEEPFFDRPFAAIVEAEKWHAAAPPPPSLPRPPRHPSDGSGNYPEV